jgi:formylglycine-generating enzyme required for sulfatase activity
MIRKKSLSLVPIALFALILLYLAGRAGSVEWQKARLYAAGESAIETDNWEKAWAQFEMLLALDPTYRDARQRLEKARWGTIEHVAGGDDWHAEVALLQRIATSGDWVMLAEALDRCVVAIPAGEFVMGNDAGRCDERPQHLVYLDGYEIDRYEITNVQYQRFLAATGRQPPPYWPDGGFPPGQAAYPVAGVTWEDADAYCTWIGRRLPTEAEWEEACRGTDGRVYPWGDTWDPQRLNVDPIQSGLTRAYTEAGVVGLGDDWGPIRTTPTSPDVPGLRPVWSYGTGASPYQVLDLAGSVSEWVADWYNWNGYWDVPDRNPLVLEPEWNRALRGSSWYPYGVEGWAQDQSRCSWRNSSHHHDLPDSRAGFRCASSIP